MALILIILQVHGQTWKFMWMIIGLTHKEFIGEIKTASERKHDIQAESL
jgi:hypothetical protein